MVSSGLDRALGQSFFSTIAAPWALLCHQASCTLDRRHLLSIVAASGGPPPSLIFSPEHGLWGEEQDMVAVGDAREPLTGARVVSLYGSRSDSLAPGPGQLDGVRTLVIDLQDVGSRYYTFNYTLLMCLEACAATGTRAVVLDRANPLGGLEIEGSSRESDRYRSFVGWVPLPVRHGLTPGEMARWHVARTGLGVELDVVPCGGLTRGIEFPDWGVDWINPSPNMPSYGAALAYPGMCLLEGTNLSEGRGTTRPFELFGAPFIDPFRLADRLGQACGGSVRFRPLWFLPQFGKWAGQRCGGCSLHVIDRGSFRPYLTGLRVVAVTAAMHSGFAWRAEAYEFVADVPAIDLLTGSDRFRRQVDQARLRAEMPPDDTLRELATPDPGFAREVGPYLMYPVGPAGARSGAAG